MNVDFLIIGQGLAGSALALNLLDLGSSVLVVDREDAFSASRVAAGLVTTVAGKGMNLSWRQSEYLPDALDYYSKLELSSGKKFFHLLDSLRIFDSEKQREKFEAKRQELAGWVNHADREDLAQWKADHGGFLMTQGGWLDTQTYLQIVRDRLGNSYRCATFDADALIISSGKIQWEDITAKRIILCQGAAAFTEEGFFSHLKHRSAKGEILTVKIPGACEKQIINCNGWLIPLGNEKWRAGATYEWNDMQGNTTEAGRYEIEDKIRNFTDLPFQVIEHTAAVRPILRSSKPVIGHHPDFPEVSFFNGLGSKGVTTAPSVAQHFADHLVNHSELDPDLILRMI